MVLERRRGDNRQDVVTEQRGQPSRDQTAVRLTDGPAEGAWPGPEDQRTPLSMAIVGWF